MTTSVINPTAIATALLRGLRTPQTRPLPTLAFAVHDLSLTACKAKQEGTSQRRNTATCSSYVELSSNP